MWSQGTLSQIIFEHFRIRKIDTKETNFWLLSIVLWNFLFFVKIDFFKFTHTKSCYVTMEKTEINGNFQIKKNWNFWLTKLCNSPNNLKICFSIWQTSPWDWILVTGVYKTPARGLVNRGQFHLCNFSWFYVQLIILLL